MARSEASCSTGWCVGPSSPSPMASWVKTKIGGQLHERREPDGGARVVAEDEEGRAEGRSFESERPFTIAPMACSRMPKWRFLPPGVAAWKSPAPAKVERGLGRWAEVRGAAEEPGDVLREHVQHLARGVAAGDPLRVGGEDREVPVPAGGQLAPLHLVDLGGELGVLRRGRRRRASVHCRAGLRAPRADPGGEVLAHAVGHEELRVLGPAVGALGEPDLLVAERLAVGRGGVLLVRRAVADVAVEDDEGGPPLRLPEDVEARARCARGRWRRRRAARSSRSRGSAPRRPR